MLRCYAELAGRGRNAGARASGWGWGVGAVSGHSTSESVPSKRRQVPTEVAEGQLKGEWEQSWSGAGWGPEGVGTRLEMEGRGLH